MSRQAEQGPLFLSKLSSASGAFGVARAFASLAERRDARADECPLWSFVVSRLCLDGRADSAPGGAQSENFNSHCDFRSRTPHATVGTCKGKPRLTQSQISF